MVSVFSLLYSKWFSVNEMKCFYIPHVHELNFTEGIFDGSVIGKEGAPLFQMHIVTSSGQDVTHKGT